MAVPAPAVVLADLTAGYGRRPVLHGLALRLDVGLHLVVGPNGAGKTTLFRVISGILEPWSGRLELVGVSPADRRAGLDPVAYVAERPGLPERLRVADALSYLDRLRGGPAADRAARVEGALAARGLAGLQRRRVGELSRGQVRRVALAGVALSRARVVVCDEPTANLDVASADRARADLAALAAERVVVVAITIRRRRRRSLPTSPRRSTWWP